MKLQTLGTIWIVASILFITHTTANGSLSSAETTSLASYSSSSSSSSSPSPSPSSSLASAQLELLAAREAERMIQQKEAQMATSTPTTSTTVDSSSSTSHYGDSSVESRIPRSKLLHDIASPHSEFSTLPGFSAPAGISRTISDTYEQELATQYAAHRMNDNEMNDLDEQLGEQLLPECPLDGTFHQLRRFGHRLWFEGDITLARACFDKGISLYLSPTNTIRPNQVKMGNTAPTDDKKYKNILLETHSMQEKEFEDFGHVVDLIQRRTERIYSMPWSPIRPQLHDQMLADGSLVHDPKLREIAIKRAKAKAKVKVNNPHRQHSNGQKSRNLKTKRRMKNRQRKGQRGKAKGPRNMKGKGKLQGKANRRRRRRKNLPNSTKSKKSPPPSRPNQPSNLNNAPTTLTPTPTPNH